MDLEKLLDLPLLRNIRDAAATVRAVAFFATLAVSAATLIYLWAGRNLLSPGFALAIGLALVAEGATVGAFLHYIRHVADPDPYTIVELAGLLVIERVDGHHRYINTRVQRLRANRNDLRLIEVRSHWTGRSSPNKALTEPLDPDHLLLNGESPEEDGRIYRWIYLGTAIGRGDLVDVGIRQQFEDDVEQMRPFYREGGGRHPVKKITVTTRFSLAEAPQNPEGLVWNNNRRSNGKHVVGHLTVQRKIDHDAGTVDFIVESSEPLRNHSYGIRWQWPPRRPRTR